MGQLITMTGSGLKVPDHPLIPFIEGDGTGPDIWAAAVRIFNAAVEQAYGGERAVAWTEVLAGQKAFDRTGSWLPDATEQAFRDHVIGIKGPLTTPVGGGIRSLNVALRQRLDLYVCLRPVRYYPGVPSPVRRPELVDMVVFRENTEDVYAGFEVAAGSAEAAKLLRFLKDELGWAVRPDSGIGIKPISRTGTERLVRAAIDYAIENGRRSVTLVHKGNIQKFTEGAFPGVGLPGGGRALSGPNGHVGRHRRRRRARRQGPDQGHHRRHLPAAGADPPRGVRRGGDHEPERRLHLGRAGRLRWAASASPPAPTSTTRPGTRCSKPPTAPRPSTPART